jgi:Pyruvate/2-oxoacid:ferredoxin oxidoreductase delta subunit
MHNETVKALYEYFSLDEKNNFYPSYLYLKYIDYFLNKVVQSLGIPTKDIPYELGEDLDHMMNAYIQQISEAAPTAETSIYHAKVLKLQEAIKLLSQKEDLHIDVPERVVPFKHARDIILHNPESVSLGTCACRAASLNPCLPEPMEVCIFVGDPVASFMSEHNQKFRQSSPEEAIKVLELAHEKGFVHTAWFKKEIGNCFHMICNCCSCCCMGIKMWNLMEGTIPIMAPSGYVAEITDGCMGCGICVDESFCHFNAISMNEDGDKAIISFDKCMGCGICVDRCPDDAINLRREPLKGDPLDIDQLI